MSAPKALGTNDENYINKSKRRSQSSSEMRSPFVYSLVMHEPLVCRAYKGKLLVRDADGCPALIEASQKEAFTLHARGFNQSAFDAGTPQSISLPQSIWFAWLRRNETGQRDF